MAHPEEPCSPRALAIALRHVCRALDTTGLSAVLVTHDQGEAMELAEPAVVVSMGRIGQAGRPWRDDPFAPLLVAVARLVVVWASGSEGCSVDLEN